VVSRGGVDVERPLGVIPASRAFLEIELERGESSRQRARSITLQERRRG
jgi:hypothetical protein